MAEMVGSLVVGEVVSRTSSFLISKHKERSASASSASESLERLEMAHIKMEAALEVSARWQVTDVAMLRWRRRLRRAADECDAAVHRWKLRALEEEEAGEHGPFPIEHLQASGIAAVDVKKLKDAGLCTVESVAYSPR